MGLEYITQPQVFLAPITAFNGIQGYEQPLPLVTTYQYWTSTANIDTNIFPIPGFWPMLEEPASFLINIGGVPQSPTNYSVDKLNRRITFVSNISTGIEVSFTQLAAAFLSSYNFAFVESVSGTFKTLSANKAYFDDIDAVKSISVSTTDVFTSNIYFPLSVGGYIHEDTVVFGNVTVYGSLSATGEVVTAEVANLSSQSVVANNTQGKTALEVLQSGTPTEPIVEIKGVLEKDIFRVLSQTFPSHAAATLDGILSATGVLSPSLSGNILKTPLIHNNNNITLSATDNIVLNTNNFERVRVDKNTGFVGINTPNPTATLHVSGNVHIGGNNQENFIAFRGTFADDQTPHSTTYIGERVYQSGTERSELLLYKGNDAVGVNPGPDRIRLLAGDIVFDTLSSSSSTTTFSQIATGFSTQRMVLSSVGNLGLNVAVPTQRFELNGNQLFQNTNQLQWRDTGGTPRTVLFGLWSDNSTYLETQNAMIFRTAGSVPRFTINSSGNLTTQNAMSIAFGAGVEPAYTLDVNGTIGARTNVTNADREVFVGNPTTINYGTIYRYNDSRTDNSRSRLAIWNVCNVNGAWDTNRGGWIDFRPFEVTAAGATHMGRLYLWAPRTATSSGGDIYMYAGGNFKMGIIGNNGFVGINTSAPVRQLHVNGIFRNQGHPTTTAGANTHITVDGDIYRSTSSILYKTNVEDLNDENANLIYKLRPVWYRSTCVDDPPEWSWYGLIAEEVAKLDPRLVQWGYHKKDYDKVTKTREVPNRVAETNLDGTQKVDEKGNVIYREETSVETYEEEVLKENAEKSPVNVQYDRLPVLLIKTVQDLKAELDAVKKELADLKNSI